MQGIMRTDLNLFFREAGLTNVEVGNIMSASLWGAAILGLVVSILADILGRKRMLLASIVFFPLANLGMIMTDQMPLLLLFSFVKGGFMVVGFTVVQAMVVDLTASKDRARVVGINFGLLMASGVLGNFLGGVFGDFLGLKEALIIAIIGYFFGMIPLLIMKEGFKGSSLKSIFNITEFKHEQKVIVLFHFMTTITIGFGAGLFIHFGNLIFKDLFSMTPLAIGIALSIAQLGTAFGSALSHKFGLWFGPLKFKMITQTLVVPLIVAMAFVRNPIIFVIIYAMRFVLMNSSNPIINTIINSYVPQDKISTLAGINSLLNNSVRAVAAMMFGFIVGKSIDGYTTLFIISAIFYGINILISYLMYKRYRNDPKIKELYAITN